MDANKLKGLMINDEGFAFDPRSGNTFSMNVTGLFVVNALKAGASRAEILEQLVENFDIDEQAADRDLAPFLNELSRYKLVQSKAGS